MRQISITHALFDWSGTLSNDPVVIWTTNNRMFAQKGKPTLTLEEWRARSRMTAAEMMRDHGIDGSDEEIHKWYEQELGEVKASGITPQAYPASGKLLRLLKSHDLPVGILSTHPRDHLLEEADRYGLRSYITHLIGGATNKVVGLRNLLSLLRVPSPNRTIYVGDTVYDIQAAKEAGVVSVALCEGFHNRQRLETEDPDFLFENLEEMSAAVESGWITNGI